MSKTRVVFFGHAYKKHRFELAQAYLAFSSERVFRRQHYDRSVAGDALPLNHTGGGRRRQPHETQVNFS